MSTSFPPMRHMAPTISVAAPAKVNFGLAILGRRPDGYHDILSVFQAVSWADHLALDATPSGITVACSQPEGWPPVPAGRDNLVWRAAELVARHFRRPHGVAIRLEKRIPAGAGLGGGSSDAAATLRALAALWEIDAKETEWLDLCARLGSDVPFFFHALGPGSSGTAIVEGRGERIRMLPPQEPLILVIAVPTTSVSTAWAYRQVQPPYRDHAAYRARVEALAAGTMTLRTFCRELENDFEPIVERHVPAIAELHRGLVEAGAVTALMSGSGSAVFGIFGDRAQAERAVGELAPDAVRVVATSLTEPSPAV